MGQQKPPCDKRGASADGQTFVTSHFCKPLACTALLARLTDYCHFCHCHGIGMKVWSGGKVQCFRLSDRPLHFVLSPAKWIGGGANLQHVPTKDRPSSLFFLCGGNGRGGSRPMDAISTYCILMLQPIESRHQHVARFHESGDSEVRKSASFHEAGALSSTVC